MNTELITALANILTIPPAATDADQPLHDRILRDRVDAVQRELESVLAGKPHEAAAEVLRRRTRELPITYRTGETAPDAPDAPYVVRGLGIELEFRGGS